MGVQVYRPQTQNPYHVILISMQKVANIANNYPSAHPTEELKQKMGHMKIAQLKQKTQDSKRPCERKQEISSGMIHRRGRVAPSNCYLQNLAI